MASPVRAGLTRIGRRATGGGAAQAYPDTMSGYGPTRGDSMGYNPANPRAYSASQGAKAYQGKAAMTPEVITPSKFKQADA